MVRDAEERRGEERRGEERRGGERMYHMFHKLLNRDGVCLQTIKLQETSVRAPWFYPMLPCKHTVKEPYGVPIKQQRFLKIQVLMLKILHPLFTPSLITDTGDTSLCSYISCDRINKHFTKL